MNRASFFAAVRVSPFGGSLSQPQVDGLNAILDEWDKRKLTDVRWLAYMLATTFHETAQTMQPIREFGRGKGKQYGTIYYGRGFVQLTWEDNYRKMSAIVAVDLVARPDRALEMPIAAAIMFDGMIRGLFTGKKLADYINSGFCDYQQARRIINGTDRAMTIVGYALQFERALKAAAGNVVAMPDHDQPVIVPAEPKPTLPPRPPPDVPGPDPDQTDQPPPVGGFLMRILAAIVAAIFPKKV